MKAAWILVRPNFDDAVAALTVTAGGPILQQLPSLGLTGPNLVFKLSVFQHARGALLDHGTPKDGQQKGGGWWKTLRRLFKPTLKSAHVIVDSLSKEIPGGEMIKEFMGSVVEAIELRG
jgi:hypothetical protein